MPEPVADLDVPAVEVTAAQAARWAGPALLCIRTRSAHRRRGSASPWPAHAARHGPRGPYSGYGPCAVEWSPEWTQGSIGAASRRSSARMTAGETSDEPHRAHAGTASAETDHNTRP